MSTKTQIKVKKSELAAHVKLRDKVLWRMTWHKIVGEGGLPWARFWLLEDDSPVNAVSSMYAEAYTQAQSQRVNRIEEDEEDTVVAGVATQMVESITASARQEAEEPVRYPQEAAETYRQVDEPTRVEDDPAPVLENPDPPASSYEAPSYEPPSDPSPVDSPSVDSGSYDSGSSSTDGTC